MSGRVEYYIKWENYDEGLNTWEPLVNLVNCMSIIAEYENEQDRKALASKNKFFIHSREKDAERKRQILGELEVNQGHFEKNDKPLKIRSCRT